MERISAGESLRDIAKSEGMPEKTTILRWVSEDTEFRDQYARAMLVRADIKFMELDEVADEAANAESAVRVNGLRLKADNIKWQLARMNPKKYGDRLETTLKGDPENPVLVRLSFG